MRSWLTGMLVATAAAASVAVAPLALASPHKHHLTKQHHVVRAKRAAETTTSENARETAGGASESESPNDATQQSDACRGLGDNVQYDEQTGKCSTDAGGGPNDQSQN